MTTQPVSLANSLLRRPQVRPTEWEKIKTVEFWHTAFVIVAMMLFAGAIMALVESGGAIHADVLPESSKEQAVYGIIFLITLCLMGFKSLLAATFNQRLFLALYSLIVFSFLWSYVPDVTLRREAAFLGTSMFGMYIGLRYELRDQMKLIAVVALIGAVLSYGIAILMPWLGIEGAGNYVGAFRGIFPAKNSCGRMMAIGALDFALLLTNGNKRKRWWWVGLALCSSLLLLSRSLTALASLFGVACLIPFYKMLQWPRARWRTSLVVPALSLSILPIWGVFYWVIANQALILKAVGRNPTLTGRVQLWRDLLKMAQNRPLLGYGFKSFFLQNGPVRVVWQHIHWHAVHAHNGYLDTFMELGLVGLALVLIIAAVTAWHGFKWLRIHRTMEGMWPLAIITFILGYNLAEASFLRQNSFTWVVFVATAFGLSKQLKLHERSVRVARSVKRPLLQRNGFGQSPVETC